VHTGKRLWIPETEESLLRVNSSATASMQWTRCRYYLLLEQQHGTRVHACR